MTKIQKQPPGHGCDNCGKWEEGPDHIKRKRLRYDGNDWLCAECRKDGNKPISDNTSEMTEILLKAAKTKMEKTASEH